MRIAASLLAFILALPAFAAPPTALRIDVQPLTGGEQPALRIDLRYKAGAGGQCFIELPNEWADQKQYYKTVHGLRLLDSKAALRETEQPHVRGFDCKPGAPVHLQYELRQDFAGAIDNAKRYRFTMEPGWFHLIGYAGWVLPKAEENDPLTVDLRWTAVPAGWKLANSFGTEMRRQAVNTTFDGFRSAVFVGGDFRLYRMKDEAGQGVNVAMRGKWEFTDDEFTGKVRQIIGTERAFWRSKENAFLVTVIPLSDPPGHTSLGGTGLTSAFATFFTPNAKLDDMLMLLAHEYFHNWNNRQLGTMAQPEQSVYWISEGFTDYYAALLLVRTGQWSLDTYLAHCNRLLRNVYMSPAREAPNARVVEAFWSDYSVQKLPYNRGNLLAMEWQARIHAASGGRRSFDDVMHGLQRPAADAQKASGKLPDLTAARVAGMLEQQGVSDAAALIQRHIEEGQLIVPRAEWFGPAMELREVDVPVFELGLDIPKLREKTVAVTEGSAAYAAGLRNGQRIIKRDSINLNDTEQFIEMTVEDGEGQKTVRFQPRAAKGWRVPQFFLRPDASAEQLAQTRQLLGIPSR